MVFAHALLLATAGLIQSVNSAVLPGVKTILVNNIVVPKTKQDFVKNNVTAKWAPSYPKEWGSEDFHYQFGTPDPDDNFNAVITEDEKILVLANRTHAKIINLETNSTTSIFQLQVPEKDFVTGLSVRPATKGGYDLFTGVGRYIYNAASTTIRQRIGSDFNPVGTPITYQGPIGAISKQGKLASLRGYIYDLETTSDTPVATLKGQPDLTDFSFSPDGIHLATVSWHEETADLWNATSGEKIFQFPATKSQNWLTRFSPDGKYIAFALGSANNTVQIYQLSNLTAAPIEIKGFNDWPRQFEWNPTSHQIAIGDDGRVKIYNVPSKELVQTWKVDVVDSIYPPYGKPIVAVSLSQLFKAYLS